MNKYLSAPQKELIKMSKRRYYYSIKHFECFEMWTVPTFSTQKLITFTKQRNNWKQESLIIA